MRLLMISLVASTLGGCVDANTDGALLITKNVAPGMGCTFTADVLEPFLAMGTLDTRVGGPYILHPQLRSRITADITNPLNIDQRTVILQGANISISFPNPPAGFTIDTTLLQFRQLFSAPIAPNGGLTDVSFLIIPSTISRAVFPQLTANVPTIVAVASVVVDGQMGGGTVTSQPFQFPVNLTTGLVIDNGTCPLPMTFGTIRAGDPCNPSQDGVVDCCRDAAGNLRCPAT
ncbi:MAG: hypothetical protein JWO36_2962 [Myxococcales bacterium]|nr:hypothetical protein [Myxococcales bacterium]